MYIQKVTIENIRSIDHFEMEFPKPAGWHVLIGDNGSGKSSIVRAIALAIIGPTDAQALRLPLINWIKRGCEFSEITLTVQRDQNFDGYSGKKRPLVRPFESSVKITKEINNGFEIGKIDKNGKSGLNPFEYIWSGKGGWFSTAFGPFRRFTGGDKDWSKVYYSNPRAAAHLSVFGEDVALTESLEWLSLMKFQSFEEYDTARTILEGLKIFINDGGLLPHNTKLTQISSTGVIFKDGNNCEIDINQLSDGFRSLLSLIFELIRQLVKTYGETSVFHNIFHGDMVIDVPGVVLIDEVDAHLHPSWQTRIGEWFTQYFPNIQFIVTTHSPLVCRACEKGSIWRLSAPGSDIVSGEIIGKDKQKLINGNILDAYGTEIFGSNVVRSTKSNEMLDELGKLGIKAAFGKTSPEEDRRRVELQQILSTDDPTGF
jgi:energy-coupling factor transporter ATP-binding protein EcfA2